jgi:hypothetical protein
MCDETVETIKTDGIMQIIFCLTLLLFGLYSAMIGFVLSPVTNLDKSFHEPKLCLK